MYKEAVQEYREDVFLFVREPDLIIEPFCSEELPFPLNPSLRTISDLKDDGVRIEVIHPAPSQFFTRFF